jgi:hypothetical protein
MDQASEETRYRPNVQIDEGVRCNKENDEENHEPESVFREVALQDRSDWIFWIVEHVDRFADRITGLGFGDPDIAGIVADADARAGVVTTSDGVVEGDGREIANLGVRAAAPLG